MTETDLTALDRAHLAAEEAPDDTLLRARIYEILAESELFVLLDEPAADAPADADPAPRIFDLEEGRFVLAFDLEERLSQFAGGPAGYAAVPGRVLAGLLAEQGLGLGLNLDSVSARMLPPDALAWLAEMLTIPLAPESEDTAPPRALAPDRAGPVLKALAARAESFAGMARAIHLSAGSDEALRLTLEGAPKPLRAALAHALSEALRFGVPDEAQLAEIAFVDSLSEPLAALAQSLPLPARPEAKAEEKSAPKAPGSDPERPPILRF